MHKSIIEVGHGFWNIRGSYKVAGLLDVGTQASLLRLGSGRFVLLDTCDMSEALRKDIAGLSGGVDRIDAIVNLHPFHTLHVEATHGHFPSARLYGTVRHRSRLPGLPWEKERTDSKALHRLFAGDLAFSVPRGVDFISENENVHFSSVLAYHEASRTIHSDDTFNHIRLAGLLEPLGLASPVAFHPTLASALQPRAGAADEFRRWAQRLIEEWSEAENLCAAHSSAWLGRDHPGESLPGLLSNALTRVERTLAAHERKYG